MVWTYHEKKGYTSLNKDVLIGEPPPPPKKKLRDKKAKIEGWDMTSIEKGKMTG